MKMQGAKLQDFLSTFQNAMLLYIKSKVLLYKVNDCLNTDSPSFYYYFLFYLYVLSRFFDN